MGNAPDWNRHSAIAGYGQWVFAGISIAVAVWLGTKEPAAAQAMSKSGTDFVAQAKVHAWVLWTAAIYAVGLIVASALDFIARKSKAGVPAQDLNERDKQELAFARAKLLASENRADVLSAQLEGCKAKLLSDAPRLVVRYVKDGATHRQLVIKNDRGSSAVAVEISSITSKDRNGATFIHEITTIPSRIGLIASGTSELCRLIVKSGRNQSICPLEDALADGTPEAVDTATISYEDSDGIAFYRECTLTKHTDGSVEWYAGPVRLRVLTSAKLA